MKLVRATDYRTMPWKNGKGITHEIARENVNGTPAWRLSLAEVSQGGPFSVFEETLRILTVVKGAGMELEGPGVTYRAEPLTPVAFPGSAELSGRCFDGPVMNFNLIHDPDRVQASVEVRSGPGTIEREVRNGVMAVFALGGSVVVDGLNALSPMDTAIGHAADAALHLGPGASCIVARIEPQKIRRRSDPSDGV